MSGWKRAKPQEDSSAAKDSGYADSLHESVVAAREQVRSNMVEVDEFKRAEVHHDHGFLEGIKNGILTGEIDESKRRDPTLRDRAERYWWKTKLGGARLLRRDLGDAMDRYSHFLHGEGAPVSFDYGEYLATDPAGAFVEDQVHEAMSERVQGSEVAGCSPLELNLQSQFTPKLYPDTENWQKALGGHNLFAAGTASMRLSPEGVIADTHVDFHAEDRYNFNPGSRDMVTQIPDSENGRFEQTGLAQGFLQTGRHQSRRSKVVDTLAPPLLGSTD